MGYAEEWNLDGYDHELMSIKVLDTNYKYLAPEGHWVNGKGDMVRIDSLDCRYMESIIGFLNRLLDEDIDSTLRKEVFMKMTEIKAEYAYQNTEPTDRGVLY